MMLCNTFLPLYDIWLCNIVGMWKTFRKLKCWTFQKFYTYLFQRYPTSCCSIVLCAYVTFIYSPSIFDNNIILRLWMPKTRKEVITGLKILIIMAAVCFQFVLILFYIPLLLNEADNILLCPRFILMTLCFVDVSLWKSLPLMIDVDDRIIFSHKEDLMGT